MFKQSTHM